MFPQVRRQQAADAVVRQEKVEVAQQAPLGLVRLVLRLQHLVGDDLTRTNRNSTLGTSGSRAQT